MMKAGHLTEAVRRRPFRVLLFDEIEKAHPDVFNLLLQILEDGRLTDGHGRTVNFRNTVIIMTSNLGTEEFQKQAIGFSRQEKTETERLKTAVDTSLKRTFRPEFLNRIDDIIIFNPLSRQNLKKIVDLLIKEVQKRLDERQINLVLDDGAREYLLREGYEPAYGARPLRRAIQRLVENPLSSQILSGKFNNGDTIRVSMEGEGLTFAVVKETAEPVVSKKSKAKS